MYIYKTTNLINGTIYIGQHTGDVNDQYLGSGLLIKRAIKKYGKENFQKTIIKECNNIDDLNNNEILFIKKFNSIYPGGYNLREGGNNSLLSNSTKRKISLSRKGKCMGENNPNWNAKSFKKDTKNKISKSIKERYQNHPTYRTTISKTSKNRKHSKETKNSISQKNSGKNNGRYIHFSKKDINSIIKDYLNNISMNKIGIKFKTSPQTVKRILIESNISIIKRTN